MGFRQLFDIETGTYSYLLWDDSTRDAILIDSVREQVERDLQLIQELNLRLRYLLETHVHADHVTGAGLIRAKTGAQIGVSSYSGVVGAEVQLEEGVKIPFGGEELSVLETPGHTNSCTSFYWQERVFTGDALLIRKCGRTDFQEGDPAKLFHSVREKIFSLPDATVIYPGHDYEGRTASSVGEEKQFNTRLNLNISQSEFVEIMNGLNLADPKRIKEAVPANLALGQF